MDDHEITVTVVYHAMADDSAEAIKRVLAALVSNSDLSPYVISSIDVKLK